MLSRRSLGLLAIAVSASLLVAACGSESTTTAQPPASVADTAPATSATPVTTGSGAVTTDAPSASTMPAAVVPEILQFSAPLVGGGTFDGAAYGGTPLALWFWAPG